MPYKLSRDGTAVLVKRGGRWVVYKSYKRLGVRVARMRAKALLRALYANVREVRSG